MEILLLIAVGAVAVFWAFSRLNKENYTGSHPLDSLAKEPVVNNKTGDVVDAVVVPAPEEPKVAPLAVNSQITDSVAQAAPAKKTRKPRTPKADKPVKEKAAKPAKAAAKKVAVKRSKKV